MEIRRRHSLKLSRGAVTFLLVALVIIELVALASFSFSRPSGPPVGFLVKLGQSYIVAYRDEQREFEIHNYNSLAEALRFVRDELRLEKGHNPLPAHELEHAWMSRRFGNFVVLWKTLGHSMVNQMTFDRESDARFFLDAFRSGSYSPSLFGHSVLLRPTAAQIR